MYVRCGECRHATWLEPVSPGSTTRWDCAGCGKSFGLRGSAKLGAGPREQFRAALDFANRHRIDLPCAWSVLAELMTLDEAHACRVDMGLERPSGSPRPTAATRPVRAAKASHPPDPADASEDSGPVTSSKAKAKRLAGRTGLPAGLAAGVVRGALSLPAALLAKPTLAKPSSDEAPDPSRAAPDTERARPMRLLRLAGVVGAAALLIAVFRILQPEAADEAAAPPLREAPANTEIRRDAAGHPVEIAGPDPESVLVAYCNQADPSERCRPLKLVLGSPPRAGTRLGIFEKPGAPDALHAIEIRRKGGVRRWVAGDGDTRIRTIESPELGSGAAELPASAL